MSSGQALLTNARLVDGRTVDLHIGNGLIEHVREQGDSAEPPPSASADVVHDLNNMLLLPAMAEPHAHLDKALTADLVPNPAGDLQGAIDAWIAAASQGRLTYDDTVRRAVDALELLLANGVTSVRSHVNVGEHGGVEAVRAVHEARREVRDLIDVQTVALVHSPLTGPEGAGNRAALDAAIEEGVDVIGGCPHLDPDGAGLIRHVVNVATQAGLPIDLHVDETLDPSMLTLAELAQQILDSGFDRGVTASHCVSLGMQTPQVQREVSGLVAEATIAVVALPQTNLFLQSRGHATAPPRGLTAVDALVAAGATVAAGGDNVQDPFNLVGRSDPLETAALMVMAAHRQPAEAFDMVSAGSRRALGLQPVQFDVGDPADFVALDADTLRQCIADAPMTRRVFRAGRLVASSEHIATIHR